MLCAKDLFIFWKINFYTTYKNWLHDDFQPASHLRFVANKSGFPSGINTMAPIVISALWVQIHFLSDILW